GQVKRVAPDNRRIELTIGSDDGLVVGHELYLYHTTPRPEYLGRVRIVSVESDQAVARVVGNTYQGKKIKEGDLVSSTIVPRFYPVDHHSCGWAATTRRAGPVRQERHLRHPPGDFPGRHRRVLPDDDPDAEPVWLQRRSAQVSREEPSPRIFYCTLVNRPSI